MSNYDIQTREGWLLALSQDLSKIIAERTGMTPKPYRVSCGFPAVRARAEHGRIGECWHRSNGGKQEIFIHPKLEKPVEVAATLLHELIHAALPSDAKHKAPFARAAVACGLAGKPTATYAEEGSEIEKVLAGICEKIGPYPHEALDARAQKQPTLMRKVICSECGYILRTTSKWIDQSGAPICPTCDIQMDVPLDAKAGSSDPLKAVETSIEYKVRDHEGNTSERWSIRMSKRGRHADWFVIDYGEQILGTAVPRLTPAETRADAISILNALKNGILTYDELEALPSDDEDYEDEDYLSDDEDETPDYEDGYVSDEDEAEYVEQQKIRESIAVGDRTPERRPMRIEREPGSWQYQMQV